MLDSGDHRGPDMADRPTRLQRAARRGCAGLAYAVVLVPVALGIWFFSSIPRGWEQFGDLVTNILWWPGADTQIVVVNLSGRDVRQFELHVADHRIRFEGALETRRQGDPNQKAVHYEEMFWRPVRPVIFTIEITYVESATNVTRSAAFLADRAPRHECMFVIFLQPEGPKLSDCRRSDLEDFPSS